MVFRKALGGLLGGTLWGVPGLLLLALLSPSPQLAGLSVGLLLLGLGCQLLPLLLVSEVARSARLAAQGRWAQAHYYNILAQDKLRRSPWKGGWCVFRTAYQPPGLALTLRFEAGRELLGLGRYQEAERTLRQALREFPANAPAYHNLALALYCQGKHRLARAALQQAVSRGFVQPALEIALKWPLARLGCPVMLRHAPEHVSFYQNLGFHRIALACLSLSEEPESCWRRALSLMALGRPESARKELLRARHHGPENPYAWLGLGLLEAQEGRLAEGLRHTRQAVSLAPENVMAKEQLYLLLVRQGDPQQLLNALAVAEEHEADEHRLALARALCNFGLGRWPSALRHAVGASSRLRSLALLEVAAYALLELGQIRPGYRLLHRFCLLLEVSGLPLVERDQRLQQARQALRQGRSSPPPGSVLRRQQS